MYDVIGERIALKRITENDTDMVLKWRNSDEVRRYFIYKPIISRGEHLKWLNTKVRTGLVEQFIVYDIDSGSPFASVYFRDIAKDKKCAEYGVFIGEQDYIGKGYGCEIAKTMIRYGFEEMGLESISLRVIGDNIRANRCYVKAGFFEYHRDVQNIDGELKEVIYMKIEKGK